MKLRHQKKPLAFRPVKLTLGEARSVRQSIKGTAEILLWNKEYRVPEGLGKETPREKR